MRRAQVVLLCEDKQQEILIRRVIHKLRPDDVIRTVPMPCGRGSGEQFVRERFPAELRAQRMRAASSILVVVTDSDRVGINQRRRQFDEACQSVEVPTRGTADRVVVAIPARNIETWLSYLAGDEVNETDTYPRLPRPGDCWQQVHALEQMCRRSVLREPAPQALEEACTEYQSAFQAR